MPPRDLWEVRQAAADRRKQLREAFIRVDPQLSGQIAPFLVHQIIKANKVDVSSQLIDEFKRNGRFHWVLFCDKLERELSTYMSRAGYALGGPVSSRPASSIGSPRRLPALLRQTEEQPTFPPRAATGMLTGMLSPRAQTAVGSPRSSPRALRDVRAQKIKQLNGDVDELMKSAKFSEAASTNPWLLSIAAKTLPFTAYPEAPPGDSPRLTAALARVKPTPRPRSTQASRRAGGTAMDYLNGVMDAEEAAAASGGGGKPGKLTKNKTVMSFADKLADRFSNMLHAFKYVDIDGNGKLNRSEITRAMKLWNLPIEPEHVEELFLACDDDGDGEIDYKEFTAQLARDTVQKGGGDADAFAHLDYQMGRHKVKAVAMPDFNRGIEPTGVLGIKPGMSRADTIKLLEDSGKAQEAKDLKSQAVNQVASHFSNMRKAFHFVDVDNSGTVDAKEIRRAMHMWGIDLDDEKLALLMAECDTDGDGQIEYNEFIDHLARDTVSVSAMGKRGMQAKDAMGVDAYAHIDFQQGKHRPKNVKYDPNALN